MLKQSEADNLIVEIQKDQKNAMKNILNYAKMALDDSKFELFKKVTFNAFGLSGLQKSTEASIKKYTES